MKFSSLHLPLSINKLANFGTSASRRSDSCGLLFLFCMHIRITTNTTRRTSVEKILYLQRSEGSEQNEEGDVKSSWLLSRLLLPFYCSRSGGKGSLIGVQKVQIFFNRRSCLFSGQEMEFLLHRNW